MRIVAGVILVWMIGSLVSGAVVVSQLGCSELDRMRGIDLPAIAQALATYRNRTGQLPTEEDGLRALVAAGDMEKLPVDPWERPYQYQVRAGAGRVWSPGRDGALGGEGADEDRELWVDGPALVCKAPLGWRIRFTQSVR